MAQWTVKWWKSSAFSGLSDSVGLQCLPYHGSNPCGYPYPDVETAEEGAHICLFRYQRQRVSRHVREALQNRYYRGLWPVYTGHNRRIWRRGCNFIGSEIGGRWLPSKLASRWVSFSVESLLLVWWLLLYRRQQRDATVGAQRTHVKAWPRFASLCILIQFTRQHGGHPLPSSLVLKTSPSPPFFLLQTPPTPLALYNNAIGSVSLK